MASKLQNRTQMAPWAQRNCFRRRMIVEDIRFGWICIASLKILCGLVFLWWKVCTCTEKLNCAKCNGLQILLNFLDINLEKVLHSSNVHSSLVDYLTQLIYAKNCPTTFFAFFNWYGFLWRPRKISGSVSLAPRKHFFHKGSPFGERKFKWIQRGNPYEKSVF